MANKRMFSKDIVGSDAFQDMPSSSQLLYFHLGMEADDDGFIGNPKKIARAIGMADDDMKILVAKRFVILFDSGVLVIKHHRINNNWDKYNCKRTMYLEEFGQLYIKPNKAYTKDKLQGIPLQSGNSLETVFRIDKNRIEKNRKDTSTVLKKNNIYKGAVALEKPEDSLLTVELEDDVKPAKKKNEALKSATKNFKGEKIQIHQTVPKTSPIVRKQSNNSIPAKKTSALFQDYEVEEEKKDKKTRSIPEHIKEFNIIQNVFKHFTGQPMEKVLARGSKYDLNVPTVQRLKETMGSLDSVISALERCFEEISNGGENVKFFPTFSNMLEFEKKQQKIIAYFNRKR